MKLSALATVMVIFLFSLSAQAAPQTTDCGTDIKSLARVVASKYLHTFPETDYAYQFIGNWGPITISATQPFHFIGADWSICPQEDGTVYIYQPKNPSQAMVLKIQNKDLVTLVSGTGLFAVAAGDYPRTPEQVANVTKTRK